MTRRRYKFDPDVSNADLAEIWDAQDDATPTRADEQDAYPTPYTPGPLTDALDDAMRYRRYAQCREAAEDARLAGDHVRAREWDTQAERWAG